MPPNFDPKRNITGSSNGGTCHADPPASVANGLFHLHFDWRSHGFEAVLSQGKDENFDLTVTSDLGLLPYTAEGRQQRINLFAILRAARGSFPVRIDLIERQRLKLTARAALPSPVTATAAIASVTTLLVQARPYLDMIRMMQPASIRLRQ